MSPSNSSHIAQSPLNDPSTEVATLDGATLDGDKSPSGIANADLEKATPIEDGEDDAPPDGGFEAWVVMIGVRPLNTWQWRALLTVRRASVCLCRLLYRASYYPQSV